jgi:hypothetical protein
MVPNNLDLFANRTKTIRIGANIIVKYRIAPILDAFHIKLIESVRIGSKMLYSVQIYSIYFCKFTNFPDVPVAVDIVWYYRYDAKVRQLP